MSTLQVQRPILVERIGGLAAKVLEDPVVKQALAAADGARGLVITSEAMASEVADRAQTLRAGRTAIANWKARVLELPKAMENAARAATRSTEVVLDDAIRALGMTHSAFVAAQRRRAAEQDRAAREAAQAASEAARAVDPDAPDVAVPETRVSTVTRAGSGVAYTRRTPQVELVDAAEYARHDPLGLQLASTAKAQLLAEFRDWRDGRRPQPEGATEDPAGGFVWRGVRFFETESSNFRGNV